MHVQATTIDVMSYYSSAISDGSLVGGQNRPMESALQHGHMLYKQQQWEMIEQQLLSIFDAYS